MEPFGQRQSRWRFETADRIPRHVLGMLSGFLALFMGLLESTHAGELRLLTSPWPPSNYLNADGEPEGIAVDVVEALKAYVGVTTPIEVIPWARGYLTAQNGPNVMLFTAAKTAEREAEGFQFIGPVIMWSHLFWARADSSLNVDSLDDLIEQGVTAAAVRGSWQAKYIEEAGLQLVDTDDHEMAARMLLAGRVDLWLNSGLQSAVIMQRIGREQKELAPILPVRQSPTYLMISKDTDPDTLSKWRDAFDDLSQTRTFETLADKWSTRLGIALTHSPKTGFLNHRDLDKKGF